MEESQIQALIDQAMSSFKSEILSEVTKGQQGLASALTKEISKKLEKVTQAEPKSDEPATDESKDRLTLKALQTQIEQLNNELKQKEQRAFESERSAAISKLIAGSTSINKGLLQKVFTTEYANQLQKEGDSWYLEQEGQVIPIDKALQTYLSSEEGACFLPPSPIKGSGSFTSQASNLPSKQPASLDESYSSFAQKLVG